MLWLLHPCCWRVQWSWLLGSSHHKFVYMNPSASFPVWPALSCHSFNGFHWFLFKFCYTQQYNFWKFKSQWHPWLISVINESIFWCNKKLTMVQVSHRQLWIDIVNFRMTVGGQLWSGPRSTSTWTRWSCCSPGAPTLTSETRSVRFWP